MTLAANHITAGYDGRTVLDGLDLTIPDGEVTVIVGANASGKSTLLRTLGRLIAPTAGTVTLDGTDVARLGRKAFARRVGLLPQDPVAPESVTVADLVSRGRYPHRSLLSAWSPTDDAAIAAALDLTGTAELARRPVAELSGGQRQRVWIALVLAQDPGILLLDEPTTFLDLAHQIDVLDLLARLNAERGTTVAMVLHDLNLAARYADHLVVMADGAVLASGAPALILDAALVERAFGIAATVITDPVTGGPLVIPHSNARRTP